MVVSRIKQIKGMNSWEDPATLPEGVVKLAENMRPNTKDLYTREGLVKWGEVVVIAPGLLEVTLVTCIDGFDRIEDPIPIHFSGTVTNTGDVIVNSIILNHKFLDNGELPEITGLGDFYTIPTLAPGAHYDFSGDYKPTDYGHPCGNYEQDKITATGVDAGGNIVTAVGLEPEPYPGGTPGCWFFCE
jgi:hypothetical protein